MKSRFFSRVFRPLLSALMGFFRFIWRNLQFSSPSSKRARLGLFIISLVLVFVIGSFTPMGFHPVLDPVIGVLLSLIIGFLGGAGFLLAFKIIQVLPRFYGDWGILLMGVILVYLSMFFPGPVGVVFGLIMVILESLFFSGLLFLIHGNFRSAGARLKVWSMTGVAVGLAFNIYVVYWLADRGTRDYLVDNEKVRSVEVEPLKAENPASEGSYRVREIHYGSQLTRNRPEFGNRVDIITQTVDGSDFVGEGDNLKMKLRKILLGHDLEHMPLNGTVWYPDAHGSYPLVLIVHGNHNLADFSDPGYEYLGRHLASRGFISVSVDENFLNGSTFGGLSNENDARAWMLLQHLRQWHQWNRTDTCRFYNLVDTSRIALIGHSRGGEAAAIAGNFNRLPYYPDDATIPLGFNYHIRSIIAIAPSEAQYNPAGKRNRLHGINYFTLQGAHDADVSSFMGMRQYHHADVTADSVFKASVYAYRANHGQFNSVWGNTDYGWPLALFLNREPLLDSPLQQELGKVFMTGFLEATLNGKDQYREMFRDHRVIRNWLPPDIYITRFEDDRFIPLCTYEEDVDVTTGTYQGVTTQGDGLAIWKEHKLGFRGNGDKDNNALTLGWRNDTLSADSLQGDEQQHPVTLASYTIQIPEAFHDAHALGPDAFLAFSAANTREEVPEEENGKENKEEEPDKENGTGEKDPKASEKDTTQTEEPVQVDFSVSLVDSEGNAATLPLSQFAWIPPVLESQFLKLKMANNRYGSKYEVTLQDFALPLQAFMEANPEFDPQQLQFIDFIFDQTPQGVVVIDHVGFEG
jgi:dienelactone hydrolase